MDLGCVTLPADGTQLTDKKYSCELLLWLHIQLLHSPVLLAPARHSKLVNQTSVEFIPHAAPPMYVAFLN